MRILSIFVVASAIGASACGGESFTYAGDVVGDAGDTFDSADAFGVARDSGVESSSNDAADTSHNSDASDGGVTILDASGDGAEICFDGGTLASMCNGNWFSPPSRYCNELDAIENAGACAGCNYTCACLIAATTCAQGTTPICGIGIEGSGGDGISIRCPQ